MHMLNLILACHDSGMEEQPFMVASAIEQLTNGPAPVFVIGGAIAIIAIISSTITKVTVARAREQTRREVAAYVAEGTIDPDKAVEILKAGKGSA